MGTRADFYVGRGKDAKWLGSVGLDGYPSGIDANVLAARSEVDFVAAVSAALSSDRSATLPEQGWPWPWNDSLTTDYAYAFDDGKVWASYFGHGWFDPLQEEPEHDENKTAVFPDMSAIKSVTFGPRSGLIVLQG